jgi:predicted phosphodiesterase
MEEDGVFIGDIDFSEYETLQKEEVQEEEIEIEVEEEKYTFDQTKKVFFVISDWGSIRGATPLAAAMDNWARQNSIHPDFILSLGDNFYPKGVQSVNDPIFQKTWSDIFLIYPTLRVPWRVILGNHDYKGNPYAEVEFTYSNKNPDWLWYMPDFNYVINDEYYGKKMDFFVVDTNGAQFSLLKRNPQLSEVLKRNRVWLEEELGKSEAWWKIVLGHHPVYTKGRKHGIIGRCLRDESYVVKEGSEPMEGFAFENVFRKGGIHMYLAGHEHALQYKKANGIHYFVVSSGGAGFGFNGGEDKNVEMDWFNKMPGFLVFTILEDSLEAQFIDTKCNLLHTVHIKREDHTAPKT